MRASERPVPDSRHREMTLAFTGRELQPKSAKPGGGGYKQATSLPPLTADNSRVEESLASQGF